MAGHFFFGGGAFGGGVVLCFVGSFLIVGGEMPSFAMPGMVLRGGCAMNIPLCVIVENYWASDAGGAGSGAGAGADAGSELGTNGLMFGGGRPFSKCSGDIVCALMPGCFNGRPLLGVVHLPRTQPAVVVTQHHTGGLLVFVKQRLGHC